MSINVVSATRPSNGQVTVVIEGDDIEEVKGPQAKTVAISAAAQVGLTSPGIDFGKYGTVYPVGPNGEVPELSDGQPDMVKWAEFLQRKGCRFRNDFTIRSANIF